MLVCLCTFVFSSCEIRTLKQDLTEKVTSSLTDTLNHNINFWPQTKKTFEPQTPQNSLFEMNNFYFPGSVTYANKQIKFVAEDHFDNIKITSDDLLQTTVKLNTKLPTAKDYDIPDITKVELPTFVYFSQFVQKIDEFTGIKTNQLTNHQRRNVFRNLRNLLAQNTFIQALEQKSGFASQKVELWKQNFAQHIIDTTAEFKSFGRLKSAQHAKRTIFDFEEITAYEQDAPQFELDPKLKTWSQLWRINQNFIFENRHLSPYYLFHFNFVNSFDHKKYALEPDVVDYLIANFLAMWKLEVLQLKILSTYIKFVNLFYDYNVKTDSTFISYSQFQIIQDLARFALEYLNGQNLLNFSIKLDNKTIAVQIFPGGKHYRYETDFRNFYIWVWNLTKNCIIPFLTLKFNSVAEQMFKNFPIVQSNIVLEWILKTTNLKNNGTFWQTNAEFNKQNELLRQQFYAKLN
ncbi:MAG3960 family lipoprotein [Mycoplasmopsis columbinasalis]|uniref:Lipoprotein n=1 Tax=Mycoplasmopsis columbinasalis TaxID=114880 RepID=A0A449BAM9_9BACT|nr:hypothetical protein [Mycoplasmopsis columbinasalis]VEU78255.1 Uncharacterised protein [Mycoplasmopsis columbinasalis]